MIKTQPFISYQRRLFVDVGDHADGGDVDAGNDGDDVDHGDGGGGDGLGDGGVVAYGGDDNVVVVGANVVLWCRRPRLGGRRLLWGSIPRSHHGLAPDS